MREQAQEFASFSPLNSLLHSLLLITDQSGHHAPDRLSRFPDLAGSHRLRPESLHSSPQDQATLDPLSDLMSLAGVQKRRQINTAPLSWKCSLPATRGAPRSSHASHPVSDGSLNAVSQPEAQYLNQRSILAGPAHQLLHCDTCVIAPNTWDFYSDTLHVRLLSLHLM